MTLFRGITKTIWFISLVSLFTDMASEMLYPVMPLYLKNIGYSMLIIGILEGFAEAVAGLGKSYFGRLSDVTGKRLPFVQLGYFFSAISKPMLAVSAQLWWIFLARFTDRAGKGLRTAARDAMLNDETTASNKATVFGFHRSMDTLGAVLGPLLALGFLFLFPGNYQQLFLLAAIPGAVAVLFTFMLREKKTAAAGKKIMPFHHTFSYWKHSSVQYKRLLIGLLLFALFNSSDVFLLLKMKEAGLPDAVLIGVYVFYNLVYALFAFPVGKLADKMGMKSFFLIGLIFYVLTYAGFAFANNTWLFVLLFGFYGVYAAATESVAKAWISSLTPSTETASAIGLFSGLQSIAALIASSFAGFIWVRFGAATVFIAAASVTVLVLLWLKKQPVPQK